MVNVTIYIYTIHGSYGLRSQAAEGTAIPQATRTWRQNIGQRLWRLGRTHVAPWGFNRWWWRSSNFTPSILGVLSKRAWALAKLKHGSHAEWACHLTSECAGTSLGGSMAARLSSQSWKEWDVGDRISNFEWFDLKQFSLSSRTAQDGMPTLGRAQTTPALLRWSAMPGRADGTAPSSRCLSTRGYTALYRYTQYNCKVGHADVSIPWTWNGLTILQNLQSLVAHDLVQISFRAVALHIPSRPLGSRRGMWSCLSRQLNLAVHYALPGTRMASFQQNHQNHHVKLRHPWSPLIDLVLLKHFGAKCSVNHLCWGPRPQLDWSHHRKGDAGHSGSLMFLVRRWATKAATKWSGTRPKRRESAAAVRNKSRLMPIIGISGIWFRAWGIDAKAKIAKFQGWQYCGIPVVDLSHRKRLGAGPTPVCGFWSDAWPVLVKHIITPWNSSKHGDLRMFFLIVWRLEQIYSKSKIHSPCFKCSLA